VIVEKNRDSKLPDLENKKFLVEKDSSAAQFLYTVRKRLPAITSEQSIFFFCGKHVVILSAFMNDLYEKYGDQDNFLYMSYAEENVFGDSTVKS
jgi:GABA(A) receptor-associated protein